MAPFPSTDILFFGGKGGVGKTSMASAFALKAAQEGKEVLLVSTDPAHNIADLFGKGIGGTITGLSRHLRGLEIDPEQETTAYIEAVKSNLKGLVKPQLIEEVYRQIDLARVSPGSEEAALFDRIVALILEERCHYDHIVFDTAPTGHTVRLLSLPELMGVWVEGMLRRRLSVTDTYSTLLDDGCPEEDPIARILYRRKERFAQARAVLLDRKQASFLFVLVPEKLPILETDKAVAMLSDYHIPVSCLIINKVLPDSADGRFLARRRLQEQQYLKEIDRRFKKLSRLRVPLLDNDITGMTDLEKLSSYLADHQT
jgi:arsenite-transporting ATPase